MHHTTHLAGAKFRPKDAQAAYDELEDGGALDLVSEPTNAFDPHAVMVFVNAEHVGYVPAKISEEITNLIADGSFTHALKRARKTIEIHFEEDII